MMCVMMYFLSVLAISIFIFFFFFNETAPTEIYTFCHTLSQHVALPISRPQIRDAFRQYGRRRRGGGQGLCRRSQVPFIPDRRSDIRGLSAQADGAGRRRGGDPK